MGDIADSLLDGSFDEQTGEYLGEPVGYPRTRVPGQYNTIRSNNKRKETPAEKKIRSIRKEIATLVNEQNISIEDARKQMNVKYGKGWRERGLIAGNSNQWSEEDLKPFM